jgi:hypothetical protein
MFKNLKNKRLAKLCRQQQQKKGVPELYDSAIILMKTHIEKLSDTGLAIILMKIQVLTFVCHYVTENTGGYRKGCLQFSNL